MEIEESGGESDSQVSCEEILPYADEPLADEEWLKKYKREEEENKKLEPFKVDPKALSKWILGELREYSATHCSCSSDKCKTNYLRCQHVHGFATIPQIVHIRCIFHAICCYNFVYIIVGVRVETAAVIPSTGKPERVLFVRNSDGCKEAMPSELLLEQAVEH